MKSILTQFRKTHDAYPYPVFYETVGEETIADVAEKHDADLDKMIGLLDSMDEDNPKYSNKEYLTDLLKRHNEMEAAKKEFFELFSEYFYTLWD